MANREVPIFIFNGLLESGKTTMIARFLQNPQITADKRVLLVLCEEGMEELEESLLQDKHVTTVTLDEESGYTPAFFAELEKQHTPDIVVIEFNGMWRGTMPVETMYPDGWQLVEIMTTVDSTTFESYSKNMRAIMIEQYKLADIVVFNRFTDEMDKFAFRGLVKAANMNIQVVFEYEDGHIDTAFDASPFDLTKDEIDIPDNDFGVFYFDIMDHAGKYDGKIVHLRTLVLKLQGTKMPGFLVGRFAMTCCENDIQFLSVYCQNNMKFKNKAWYRVTAKVVCVDASIYGEPSGEVLPALEVLSLTPAEKPEQEVVTF